MLLQTMKLHNFRCFSDIRVDFRERLTVLVGGNGTGKSTILEAAAIAVGTWPYAMGIRTGYGIRKTDARNKYFQVGSGIDVQPQFPVEVYADGKIDNKNVEWMRTFDPEQGSGSLSDAKKLTMIAKDYQERLRSGDTNLNLPVVCYYSTGRLWKQRREKGVILEKNTRIHGYIDSLDGAANDTMMIRWFKKMTIQQYQYRKEIPEYRAVCQAMEQWFQGITGCKQAEVQFNLDTNEIDLVYPDEQGVYVRIPITQLSDGYKSTISLIADIAYRMAMLNPQLLDHILSETEGVVLIDEIDLHLHPLWQQRILDDLLRIFPKVQFIVSTHAPAVINSVPSESIFILKNNQVLGTSNETYGKDMNTIIREVMEVPERPESVKNRFLEFYQRIDREDYTEAQKIFEELQDTIGDNDPELNACRVRLELEQM